MGEETCAQCHEEITSNFPRSGHASYMHDPKLPIDRQGCEGCHGPGRFHLDEENPEIIAYTKLPAKEVAAACLRCHEDVLTKGGWNHTEHAKADVSCVSCHQMHPGEPNLKVNAAQGVMKKQVFPASQPPKSLLKADEATLCGSCHTATVNEFRKNSRHPVPEGRMVCSDCHELHNSKGAKKHVSLGKDTCARCHAEKVGPFVFEHDPVAGWTGDGCTECHKPHGSHNPDLLKGFSRGTCGQCHTDKMQNHFPGRTCWSAGCHVALHGSNTSRNLLRH